MPPKKQTTPSKVDQEKDVISAKNFADEKKSKAAEKESVAPATQKTEATSPKRSARIQQKVEKPKTQPKVVKNTPKIAGNEKKEAIVKKEVEKKPVKITQKEAKLRSEFVKATEIVKSSEKDSTTEKDSTPEKVDIVDPLSTSPPPAETPKPLPMINFSSLKIVPKGSLKINPFALKQETTTTKSPVIISGIKINQLNLTPVKLSDLKISPENLVKFTNIGGTSLNISKAFSLNPQAPNVEKKRSSEVFADSSPKKVIVERIESKKELKVFEKPTQIKREKSRSSSGSSISVIKSDPYESRREGLRGVRLNINNLLGRKVIPLTPKKSKILPFKPVTVSAPIFDTFEDHFQTFECKKCELTFASRKDFIAHRKIHKKSNFSCDKCHQTFRFQTSHENHVCQFWCTICHKTISNKANLKIHMSYVHGIGEAKLYTCDCCGRTYKSKRNIDSHMKNHMESTPFNCGICGKGFSHLGALKIHMWNHRDAVNCEFCGRKFKPRSLYYHIKKCQSDQLKMSPKKKSRAYSHNTSMVTQIVDEEEIDEQMVEEYIEEYIEGEDVEDAEKWNYQVQFVKVENN